MDVTRPPVPHGILLAAGDKKAKHNPSDDKQDNGDPSHAYPGGRKHALLEGVLNEKISIEA